MLTYFQRATEFQDADRASAEFIGEVIPEDRQRLPRTHEGWGRVGPTMCWLAGLGLRTGFVARRVARLC